MRRCHFDEFPRRNHLRSLPEPGKVLKIAGDQVIRASASAHSINMLSSGSLVTSRRYRGTIRQLRFLIELEKLKARRLFRMRKLAARQHVGVLIQNGLRDIKTSRLGNGNQKDGTLQALRLERRGNQNIGIHHQAQASMQRFFFCALACLDNLIDLPRCQLARDPLRSDSSPMIFRISGSGAASFT